jgi:NSS family neurotransmitter:Na+ symporter
VLNAFLAGLGNNAASLLVGLSIFPAVFALAPVIGVDPNNVITETGPASTGMAFIWMPRLFNQMPGASLFTALFFLSLTIAALTSLIAMIEMAVRNLIDLGLTRPVALVSVWTLALLAGIPSAANIDIFQNQDWVWGLGLVVNGFFLIFAMYRYNPKRFRQEFINTPSNDIHLGRWFDWIVRYIMPAEFFFLLGWWFYQAIAVYEPEAWWHPLQTFSVGTCLFQWGVAITLFVLLNGWIVARIDRQNTI